MTRLIRKYQNSGKVDKIRRSNPRPRFKNVEPADAIANTVRPQVVSTQRKMETTKKKMERAGKVTKKANQNRARYTFLKNVPDNIAANYDPNFAIKDQGSISAPMPGEKIRRELGITVPLDLEELGRKVDLANNLNGFYTSVGHPLPIINKEAVLKDPLRGQGIVDATIDYGSSNPMLWALQTGVSLKPVVGLPNSVRWLWGSGRNLFTKTMGAVGKGIVRNPGNTATVALTTLPSFSSGDRSYDAGTIGLIAAGAFSPEIAKFTYRGLKFVPGLKNIVPKSLTWGKAWTGIKKGASFGNYAVPRLGAAAGAIYLSGTPNVEMSPEEMGRVVAPPVSPAPVNPAPVETHNTPSIDSVPLSDGTYLKGRTTLPD